MIFSLLFVDFPSSAPLLSLLPSFLSPLFPFSPALSLSLSPQLFLSFFVISPLFLSILLHPFCLPMVCPLLLAEHPLLICSTFLLPSMVCLFLYGFLPVRNIKKREWKAIVVLPSIPLSMGIKLNLIIQLSFWSSFWQEPSLQVFRQRQPPWLPSWV